MHVFNRLVGIVVLMIAGLVGFAQISFLLFETGVVLWDMLDQFCLFRYGLTARLYVCFFCHQDKSHYAYYWGI